MRRLDKIAQFNDDDFGTSVMEEADEITRLEDKIESLGIGPYTAYRMLKGSYVADVGTDFSFSTLGEEIYVAIVHDSSGFMPLATVGISIANEDEALEIADELLESKLLENEDKVKEFMNDWGDEWFEVMMEGTSGSTFTFDSGEDVTMVLDAAGVEYDADLFGDEDFDILEE